ncbi:uncharacterized protein LOC128170193 [Crassostrea angulata]|uniref:uncharacterized protein LOC128170193 n=1 Tax=Magallana angulata TaxID=2784310 RepID=UPI0022B195FE|nr:uncharacterized protein LOC128170193 [Crassostrea angulata]
MGRHSTNEKRQKRREKRRNKRLEKARKETSKPEKFETVSPMNLDIVDDTFDTTEKEIELEIKERGIRIDDTFVAKRNRTAQELFGAEDREVVKLKKILEDEQHKRDKLLRFTDHCIFLVKKCRNCKFCRP